FADARRECKRAQQIYKRIGYEDDMVRVQFTIVKMLMKEQKMREARLMLEDTENRISGMQSGDIKAEYWLMRLEYCIYSGAEEDSLINALRVCEEIRAGVKDANVALRLDAGLFRGRMAAAHYELAATHFRRYYEGVKEIVANLPDPGYADEYLQNRELVSIINDFKQMKMKTRAKHYRADSGFREKG
ncbi:MAG: hypothetical protein P8181_10645, partial [bacterium]